MAERGFCECGCGEETRIAKWSDRRHDWVKGEPLRFVNGHNRRTRWGNFIEKPETHCWIWQGQKTAAGYGQIRMTNQMAHRAFYEALAGPIPEGLTLDHLCRARLCVNPGHLEPVSLRENIRRAKAVA